MKLIPHSRLVKELGVTLSSVWAEMLYFCHCAMLTPKSHPVSDWFRGGKQVSSYLPWICWQWPWLWVGSWARCVCARTAWRRQGVVAPGACLWSRLGPPLPRDILNCLFTVGSASLRCLECRHHRWTCRKENLRRYTKSGWGRNGRCCISVSARRSKSLDSRGPCPGGFWASGTILSRTGLFS